jgi:hypothetical protein
MPYDLLSILVALMLGGWTVISVLFAVLILWDVLRGVRMGRKLAGSRELDLGIRRIEPGDLGGWSSGKHGA